MRYLARCVIVAALLVAGRGVLAADAPLVSVTPSPGAFPLVEKRAAAEIITDRDDAKVVSLVAGMLSGDVERVTSVKPAVHASSELAGRIERNVIFAGTLDHAPTIDALVAAKKIDVSAIRGKWESYLIATVPQPMPGVDNGLLIIGSDRRGTAYGMLELSEEAGVSPWYWWADVSVPHRDNLYVLAGAHIQGPPSVKYRGIFINDEDWGMQPWAAKTFEPETKDIGPKTYAKIFELLLRLKANFCWPAMHDVTKAFNIYPKNKEVADEYAIVMGSSHCEPMLRNNVTEWRDAQGRIGQAAAASYNYVINRQGVLEYWKERLIENGKYENVYTLGMRGIHDSDMTGGGTTKERAARLNQIIADQRNLIRDVINPDVTKVPQIFCPYKEVLTLYQAGAVPPDDVTLVWADDNFGYIRQLSTPEEQKRSGGSGVYYHVSYWGRPHDYLWLCTTPPALVWEELSKAYDYGARTLWVINVGDLKPAEIDITLAMAIAYDSRRYGLENISSFLKAFAARNFGPDHAEEIAAILNTYYHLNYQRKPEHMGFNASQNSPEAIQPTEFSDDEIQDRLLEFRQLRRETDALYAKLPAEQKDAFYELVVYPVRGSASQNEKLLYADLNRRHSAKGDTAAAETDALFCRRAYDDIQKETAYYNDTLAGGKWKYMMSDAPHNVDVFKMPKLANASMSTAGSGMSTEMGSKTISLSTTSGARDIGPFQEVHGWLSIAAEDFSRAVDRGDAGWKIIPGLGRLRDSVAVYPTTTPSLTDVKELAGAAPELQYDFVTTTAASAAKITIQAIPTHRINLERTLRYAVAIDNETPQAVDLETPENSNTWSINVLRNSAFGTTTHNIPAGQHALHVYMMDPGVVIDQLTIDLGGLPKSYLPPAESPRQMR